MLNDRATPLSLLATRRSGRARDLVAPGPDANEIRQMIAIASRVPDHGKLAPWRFVEIVDRDAFADLLHRAYRTERPDPGRLEVEAVEGFARQAPTLLILLSAPVDGTKIPLWEQQLSCGAAAMNLLHAGHALGYRGSWLTGWAAFSDRVHEAIAEPGERIAGFFFFGTAAADADERPRPDLAAITRAWPSPQG